MCVFAIPKTLPCMCAANDVANCAGSTKLKLFVSEPALTSHVQYDLFAEIICPPKGAT